MLSGLVFILIFFGLVCLVVDAPRPPYLGGQSFVFLGIIITSMARVDSFDMSNHFLFVFS
jgi:hypothetical protein